tara:strand:+ start:1448 stop:1888 length:441 start_codon:yes stop_codon:yes gene_type:complete
MKKSDAVRMAESRAELKAWVQQARQRQKQLSGREDLPPDPLGIALAQQAITKSEYDIGRGLSKIYKACYGRVHPKAVNLNAAKATGTVLESRWDRKNAKRLHYVETKLGKTLYRICIKASVFEEQVPVDKLKRGLQLIAETGENYA